ncbi:MAG: hypothetical protein E6K80_08865 [Candidatus Eisenbacteria bacterium]|uniref:FlgD/Vpr Ig-like domain-containing protein n=1 Tax=Eiseniibacteriota bacterium TaxID=2212470 RepID=A0A538U364_UNCEI|nr:MAG: hypothetical protein E6K80_08865 [Candidatus Eisenbacteria bacterium]
MTRFKIIPWLAVVPALLLMGPMTRTATAAPPQGSVSEEDGLQYLPMDSAPAWLDATSSTHLTTSAVGEVTISQYGAADFLVANRGRFLAVRFDPPFDAPYTLSDLAFPSRVQIPNSTPGKNFASFRSIRLYGADANGKLDKTQLLYRQNRYRANNDGSVVNHIPLSIVVADTGKAFYAVFEFPAPTSGVADTFPFLYTDLQYTEAGLFANSYASDTSGGVPSPAPVGTFTGSTLLADQNINVSLTSVLSSTAPLNAPSGTGMNARSTQTVFTSTAPTNVLADGSAAPNNYLSFYQLVRRDPAGWTPIATGGGGSGKVTIPALPGSDLQIWGIRTVDKALHHSVVSNVVVTGTATVVATPVPLQSDADEPNGRLNSTEATALSVPVADRPESIWPAGDEDDYWFYARPGDMITATATPTSQDFRNDLDVVIQLVDNSGDVLATSSSATPGDPATVSVTVPPQGGSNSLRRHFVQVVDKSGSLLDPLDAPRVLVPPTYNLSVDVETPAAFQQLGPSDAPVSGLLNRDAFAFVNAGSNPVRGNATFGYVIPRSAGAGANVKLRIYDVKGRMVTTLVSGARSAGTHFESWSGHDSRGNRLASGPYFARLDAGSWSHVVRIDLVK